MSFSSDSTGGLDRLPDGFVAVPVTTGQAGPIRLAVVVRKVIDPVHGHLVQLRERADAFVYLGCIVDYANVVLQWVELWVQRVEKLDQLLASLREAVTNTSLDDRWRRETKALESHGLVHCGVDFNAPVPRFIDVSQFQPYTPVDAMSGQPWLLCREDALLTKHGLPAYSTTLYRYVAIVDEAAQSAVFVAVTPDAPINDSVRSAVDVGLAGDHLVDFNAGGGMMTVRPFDPVSLNGIVDALTSASGDLSGLDHPLAVTPGAGETHELNGELLGDGWLFMGRHGSRGRLAESFHLKLRLFNDAVRAVRQVVYETGRPLLNLRPESFRIRLGDTGSGLPRLWTSKLVLVEPGEAFELKIPVTDNHFFIPLRALTPGIYQAEVTVHALQGFGSLRIRKVIETGEGTLIEGTLFSQERLRCGKFDFVRLWLSVGGKRIDCYVRLETQTAMATGEWRFRSVVHRFAPEVATKLKAIEGVPMSDVRFELIPHLSTPCDLYSLAVLGVRMLFVNAQTSLAEATDEIHSLARQLANGHKNGGPEIPLDRRIADLFAADPRWLQSLGPHRLTDSGGTPAQALDLVPAELWWQCLATIVRMLPAVGPDSTCSDWGFVVGGAAHRVFDPTISSLGKLLIGTRSVLFVDWRFNREIHSVLRNRLLGLTTPTTK